MILLKYQNIKIFSQKVTLQIGQKKLLWLKKLKIKGPWTWIISGLNREEIVVIFYEKEFQKANQKEFRIEKVINKAADKLYVK